MGGIDRYLEHAFDAADDDPNPAERLTRENVLPVPMLPILVRVSRPELAHQITDLPGCSVSSQLGDIVVCRGTREAVDKLASDPRVISIEASRPSVGHDCHRSIPFIHADLVHSDPALKETGDRAIVGVIDGGIDVLHQAFLDDKGKTRIMAIWDQTDPAGPPPKLQGKPAYGTLHDRAKIDGYIASKAVPPGLTRDTEGHGTHVTSIAAGRPCTPFFGGVAPGAEILIVIPALRIDPFNPRSVGYSNSHLDALAFLDELATERNLPIVVNVSQGMNAGAHDGSSGVEAGFDNFSGGGRRPGRIVVKSAGNERAHAGHAKIVLAQGGLDQFTWNSLIQHRGPDVVELWFNSADDVTVQFKAPTGETSTSIGAGQSDSGMLTSGVKYQLSYEKYHWDNGDSRVLLTVSRSGATTIDVDPPNTEWALSLQSVNVRSDGTVHAWLERDENRPIKLTNHLNEEVTLSIPGTARTVIAVGSVDASTPVKVSNYSSYGPTRDQRDKPDVAAPGENVKAARSGTANGTVPISGTSMAAPHVAGTIALLLSHREKQRATDPTGRTRQFNAAQVRAALCQTTQGFNGRGTPSAGYGTVDAKALLDRFP